MKKGNKNIISVSLSDKELQYLDNYINYFQKCANYKISRSGAIGVILTLCGEGRTTPDGHVPLYNNFFNDLAE